MKQIGEILPDLCRQKEVGLVKGNAQPDHIDMLLSIPPKFAVTMTLGFLKGKSAVRIQRELLRTQGTLFGRSCCSRGFCVSTVGMDEAMIRQYIQEQKQEKHEREQERGLFDRQS
jgi:putative transposase